MSVARMNSGTWPSGAYVPSVPAPHPSLRALRESTRARRAEVLSAQGRLLDELEGVVERLYGDECAFAVDLDPSSAP